MAEDGIGWNKQLDIRTVGQVVPRIDRFLEDGQSQIRHQGTRVGVNENERHQTQAAGCDADRITALLQEITCKF